MVARSRRRLSNLARNSPATVSNLEFMSLEFQCFWAPVESWCNRITCNFSWSCYCCHSLLSLEIFMPVWPGVLLCVLAPHPACIRYKVRHAWLVGGENGRKFAMHAQNTLKRAISSEQGEFYTAHAVRRGVQGEFYTGSGAVRLVRASFVSPWHLPCSLLPGFCRPRALRTGPAGFGMASMLVIEGVLQH